jgi:hypothetical protein
MLAPLTLPPGLRPGDEEAATNAEDDGVAGGEGELDDAAADTAAAAGELDDAATSE